mgnify:FL=1
MFGTQLFGQYLIIHTAHALFSVDQLTSLELILETLYV